MHSLLLKVIYNIDNELTRKNRDWHFQKDEKTARRKQQQQKENKDSKHNVKMNAYT